MASQGDIAEFIRSTFPSVWSLELLLFLRSHRDRTWSQAEMVKALRGSDLLVARSAQALLAAGLIDLEADGSARYRPATPDLDARADAAAREYGRSPDAVRRAIISGASGGLAAFADAFRLRKD